MTRKHECTNECHKCLNCGKRTFTPSGPARQKKYCNNFCQSEYFRKCGATRIPKFINKEFLEKMYIQEKKSVLDISKIISKSIRQVSRYLKKFEIDTRPFSTRGIREEEHWNWQGGKTQKGIIFRNRIEYKEWRKAVFERDNYTCQFCGKHGGSLQADHIKPFALFPDLRLELSNGRTLCIPCHRTTFKKNY
jgi:predicted restriction endonuclease